MLAIHTTATCARNLRHLFVIVAVLQSGYLFTSVCICAAVNQINPVSACGAHPWLLLTSRHERRGSKGHQLSAQFRIWGMLGFIKIKKPSLLLHGDKMIYSAASCWSSVVNEGDGWRMVLSLACERRNTLYHASIRFDYKYVLKGACLCSL